MKIEVKNLNLYDTLFSGQCFRMKEESDKSITVVLSDRVVNLKYDNEYLYVKSNKMENIESVIREYLDLDTDYKKIEEIISSKEEVIKANIYKCDGYKILRQDKFEMFITYIISQNNNVKRIMGSVDKISRAYGEEVSFQDNKYYLFPKYEKLKNITTEELRNFGVGFRDVYIRSALDKLESEVGFLDKLDKMDTSSALKELMSIKGIGMKVASCILLFGYHRFDTFPVDTWVRHFVSENFKVKDDIKVISKYMKDIFGEYSGVAIQYFYHIERNKT